MKGEKREPTGVCHEHSGLTVEVRNVGEQVSSLRKEFRTARNAGFWLLVMLTLSFGGAALALMFTNSGG